MSDGTEDYEKYKIIKAQNEILNSQIQNLKEYYTTNKSESLYKIQKVNELRKYNFILFVLYYICVIILALYFFMLNRTLISFNTKIIITVLFVLYPFLIDIIEQYLYFIYLYIYAYISGIAYIPKLL